MKVNISRISAAVMLLAAQTSVFASTGNLFTVTGSGASNLLSITLCLDARAQLSCQNYLVSGTTLDITAVVRGHVYPNAGIRINTNGYVPGSCTQLANGFCSFTVSSTSPATVTVSQNNELTNPRFAYIGNWYGDQISLCSIQADGELSACTGINGGSPSLFNGPYSVAINPASTIAYVGQYGGNNVFKCDINSTTGEFSGCVASNGGYTFNQPYSVSMNPAGTRLYVGQYSGSVPMQKCDITPGTGDVTGCVDTTFNGFDYPTNVQFNAAGTKAYVGNYDINYIYLCDVNTSTGDLSNCTQTPASSSRSYPIQITLNAAKNTLFSVWESGADHITICPINQATSQLTACNATAVGYAISDIYGFTVNKANTYAYLSDYADHTLSKCTVNPVTSEVSGCALTGGGFAPAGPGAIAIAYS